MAKKLITFVINDDSVVNTQGFRVLTDGIDLSFYDKNPLMLYLHIRGFERQSGEPLLPIGKFVNLRKVGSQLLGDADFDLDDEFAAKVASKAEKGILNAVSLGADPVELSEDPAVMLTGQRYPTVTKCILLEISITDLPSNRECVRLKHNGQTIQLSDSKTDLSEFFSTHKKTNETSMKSLIVMLSAFPGITLSENATEGEILAAFKKIQDAHRLELAGKETTITELTTRVKTLTDEKLAAENDAKDKTAIALVDGAIGGKKILASQKEHFVKLAKLDYDATKALLDSMTPYKAASDQITGDGGGSGEGEDTVKLAARYDELHKSKNGALAKLKQTNPEEYKKLYDAKFPKNSKS